MAGTKLALAKYAVERALNGLAPKDRFAVITYDEALNSTHELAPDVATLTENGAAPVMPGPDGRYPMPYPGLVTEREYGVPPTVPTATAASAQPE